VEVYADEDDEDASGNQSPVADIDVNDKPSSSQDDSSDSTGTAALIEKVNALNIEDSETKETEKK